MSNKTLRMKLKASILAVALTALPLSSNAAGLGKITVLSVLGQPLRAEIDITASREELISLSARIASADAFKQAGVEFTSTLTNIRFSVDKRADGQPILIMRSDQPLSEPFLDVLVEMNWASGRLIREYTFLLDPPESIQKPALQVAAPVTPPVVAAPEARREPPPVSIAQQPTPAPSTPANITPTAPSAPITPITPTAPTAPEKKPGTDMKVVRGTDGIQRIVKAEPTPEIASQEHATHAVKYGETLNRIATETRPDGVTLDQMLIALLRNNKDAFDGSNINRLKAGKTLAIPDRDTAAAIDEVEAKKVILAQSADFNAYRKKLAAAAAAAAASEQKEEAPKQAASGKITPLVKDKVPPPATGKDKLEISKSAATKGAVIAEEELLARDKALKEANSRIAELDKNISDLKKLVELKNQSMAELQKQAAKSAATPTPAPIAETKQPAPAPVVQPLEKLAAAEKPAQATPTAKPVETPAPEMQVQPPEQKPVAPKPAPAAKKPALPPPPLPEEPSFIDANPELVFGGGGVLALLLGYIGFSMWRKKRKEKEELEPDSTSHTSQGESSINSVFGSTGGQVVDTGSTANSLQTDFSLAGAGDADSSEGVDPIAEADVYMAYGRNAQAEEILLDALKTDPTRQAIHLKLLEIYAARKSLKQFETIAMDLQKLTGATGPAWEKAVQLGQQIDPQNNLYSSKLAPETGFNPAATMVLSSQDLRKDLKEEAAAGNEPMQTAVIEPAPKLASEPVEEEKEIVPESLDFDLDLTGDISLAASATSAESLANPPETAGVAAGEIDFDFDLGEPTPQPSPVSQKQASSAAPGNIDFDLGSGEPSAAPDSSSKKSDMPLDFDFDLELDTRTEAKETPPPVLPTGGVDLSSISLDLDAGIDKAPAPSIPAPAPVMDEAASQEVATKLELAQAYEEMGDTEGARELLQEVLNEGSETQQATARNKLAQLG